MNGFYLKNKLLIVHSLVSLFAVFLTLTCSVNAQALLQVGKDASDFSLKDLQGKEVNLSQFSDKKAVAIVFWSTWSVRSAKALKRFEEYHQKYADKGVQVISINADEQVISEKHLKHIKEFVHDQGVTFPVLLDQNLKTFRSYSIVALPSVIVLSEGKISYELAGLPLVGTEDLFDYLLVMAGEEPRKKVEPGYMPLHDAIANTNLARQFAKKNMNMMAYPLFKKAIEKDPKYMLPYVEMSKLYGSENKYREAEETLRKALSVEPDTVVIMSELGYLLAEAGKTEEAIAVLEKAVASDSYTPSYYYYAFALSKAGRLKESLEAFDKAISLNPFEPHIYEFRALVYEDKGMLKEAEADYRRSLELLLDVKQSS